MPGRRRLLFSLAAAMALACASGEGERGAAPAGRSSAARDVVLVSIDTLRADATGFGGHPRAATPTLDRVAREGRVWTDTHAHGVTTLPSHASLLTGLYPYEHGARENGRFTLGGGMPTLATLLRGAGFATAAFVGAYPLDSRWGLDRGFDVYDDEYGAAAIDQTFEYSERAAEEVVTRAESWWRRHEGRPRFLWIHVYDPHAPYDPPEPFRSRFADEPYLGEVAAVDAALEPFLGSVLDASEASALIVITSDHGEALGDHGEATHGLFAYESTLKVPLVFWGPGVEPGEDDRPARLIDVLPTVCELLGVDLESEVSGRSLLAGGGAETSSYFEALSAHLDYGWAPLRGVVSGGAKLIELPLPELYDLAADPEERENRFDSDRARARELATLLPQDPDWPPRGATLSAEEARRLRDLGYMAGSAERRTRYTAEDDPKNLVRLDAKLTALPSLHAQARWEDGVKLAREIVAERPEMPLGNLYLARFLMARGDLEEALDVLRGATRRGAASPELLTQLGLALVRAGRSREALEVTAVLDSARPGVEVLNLRAVALASLGRLEEARAQLDRALAESPDSAQALETLAFIAIQEDRHAEARRLAERALALDESRPDAWNNLAVALYWLGERTEAIEAWERCLDLVPDQPDALLGLGIVLAESGRAAEARDHLERFLAAADASRYADARRQAAEILRQLS